MNLKLLFGVLLPLFIIILLVILETTFIGLKIEKKFVPSVDFYKLFTNQTEEHILIQTITIKNKLFLTKRYTPPKLLICVNEEGTQIAEELEVVYKLDNSTISPFIEIPPNTEEELEMYIIPLNVSDYEYSVFSYEDFDEIVILEKEDKKIKKRPAYYPCFDFNSLNLTKIITIPLIK